MSCLRAELRLKADFNGKNMDTTDYFDSEDEVVLGPSSVVPTEKK